MNTFKNIIITFFVLFQFTAAFAQRDVYWLHGLNGDQTNWLRYANRFQNDRLMSSVRPFYASDRPIDEITTDLNITADPQNIAIGHSLGGIVARNNERLGLDDYGGVITVHSPNLGSSIATARNDGRAEDFLNNTTGTILEALAETQDHLGTELFILDLFGADIPNEENVVAILDGAFDLLNDEDIAPIVDDLDPTNNFIGDLNAFPAQMPRIDVHGYEVNREMYRLACSQREEVFLEPLTEDEPYPDDCVIDIIEDARAALAAAEAALYVKAGASIFNIFKLSRVGRFLHAASDVKNAKRLFNDRAELEHGFEDLLGVQWRWVTTTREGVDPECLDLLESLEQHVERTWQDYQDAVASGGWEVEHDYYLDEYYQAVEDLEDFKANNLPCPIVTITESRLVPTDNSDQRHDGFILQSEQQAPGAIESYENREVNHVEVLNHPEMWYNFNDIFNDDTFFKTDPR